MSRNVQSRNAGTLRTGVTIFRLVAFLLFASLAHAQYDVNKNIPDKVPMDQFQQFVTRPDIQVPKWDVTVYDRGNVSPGYWFVAVYEQVGADPPSPPWVGPQIYDRQGELVWSAGDMFQSANTFDFRVIEVEGQRWMSVLCTYLESAFLLDEHYRIRKTIPLGARGQVINMHDFNVIENGTRALALHRNITDPGKEQINGLGRHGQCRAISQWFEERDITRDGWNTVFRWNSLYHIGMNESTMTDGECRGVWDFLHANSLDKCPDGHYVLSGRHTDTIYKVDKDDGHIIWRLGGKLSDFKSHFRFSRQHHIRCRAANETHTVVSMLDNAAGQDSAPPTNDFSRGIFVSMETSVRPMKASIIAEYAHPAHEYTRGRGDCETLPNGNVWMGWSDRGLQSEHSADGRMVMKANMVPDWIRTYRSYKYEFVGRPTTNPDVVSKASPARGKGSKSTQTDVYVSWNGATEVAYWRVYVVHKKADPGDSRIVRTAPREGFETVISLDGYADRVVVQALDANGEELLHGRSLIAETSSGSKVNKGDIVDAFDPEVIDGAPLQGGHVVGEHDGQESDNVDHHHHDHEDDTATSAETPATAASTSSKAQEWKFFGVGVGLSLVVCFGIWVCARWVRQAREVKYQAVAGEDAERQFQVTREDEEDEEISKAESLFDREHEERVEEQKVAFVDEDEAISSGSDLRTTDSDNRERG